MLLNSFFFLFYIHEMLSCGLASHAIIITKLNAATD